ncbi:MAG: hypothetical protein R2827_04040 [Bdellovibrionales bacterium]
MKLLLSIISVAFAWNASANQINAVELFSNMLSQPVKTYALNWTVGDRASYNIDMGIIKGTNEMLVREKNDRGFWVEQNMDLGFAGQQKAEILFDKNTGQILEFIVNGQQQDIPEPGEQEVIDMREDNITVPAGNFDCVYFKIRDKESGDISEAWINPQLVPISGAIKQVSPGPMGLTVTLELTSFEKN